MRTLLSALLLTASITGAQANDVRVFPAAPARPAASSGAAPASVQRYLEVVAGMIEQGLKNKCGTDTLGQMVFSVPALASTGTAEQRAAQAEWSRKAFQRIQKLGDASKLPKTVNTPACRSLAERFEKVSGEPDFVRLVGEGLMQMVQDAKLTPPATKLE